MAEGKSTSGHDDHNRHRHHRHHHHHHHHRKSKAESKTDPWQHFQISMNEDGTLNRYGNLIPIPATGDEENVESLSLPVPAVLTKDLVLDAEKKTSLRIYRPSNLNRGAGLPIIVSLHTGAFIIFHTDTCFVHESTAKLSAGVPAVIVSVGFRNAPENRLPAHYEDAVDAVNWVRDQALNQATGDPWLRDYGDFSKCYLYGKCSGGNIALNAAIRVVDMNLEPITILGLILNQPLFGGNKRTKSEIKYAADPLLPLPCMDLLWELALPVGADRNHGYCNPLKDPNTMEKINRVGKILVIGFGNDPMIDRQEEFVRMLTLKGIPVDARFDEVGYHLIDTVDPQRAEAIISFVKEFMGV